MNLLLHKSCGGQRLGVDAYSNVQASAFTHNHFLCFPKYKNVWESENIEEEHFAWVIRVPEKGFVVETTAVLAIKE